MIFSSAYIPKMSDEQGKLKETVACTFVGLWKQWKWGLLRLAECKALVKSLKIAFVKLRDGGLMVG